MSRARDIANLQSSKITADAGIDIDNINIDGTEIDLSSGDLTIDVAGDIHLDAGGSDIRLEVAGTQFGKFTRSSGDFIISSSENNKDIKFAGADDGADITALTLDMSEAGAATFNSSATFTAIAVGQSSLSGGNIVADLHTSGSGVGTQLAFANDHNTDKFFVGLEGNTTGNAMFYQQKNADINFYTNNNLRMTLDNSGDLILDDGKLKANAGIQYVQGDITAPVASIYHDSSNRLRYVGGTAGHLFTDDANGTAQLYINTDGRLGIGTTSPYAILQTEQDVAGEATALALVNNNVDGASDSVCISFGLARDNGYLFGFKAIKWIKEQAWTTTASTVDAALTFSTVENETLNERVRITAAGVFTANNVDHTGSFAVISTGANGARGFAVHASGTTVIQNDDSLDTGPALLIGRVNHDNGDQIVRFGVNGTSDIGNITESGGTVSYNAFMGSHITQAVPSDTLEGTVLESTGELIDSTDEDYKGYVQQKRLTKCKVSDTEDSPNVFGVWQVEAKTGVQFTSSLGAYFVRVDASETVSLGDLLSSKGNGTAKVQSDDIIRSKTIGKVTSLTKKNTYSDGSYLLPCVLYCG